MMYHNFKFREVNGIFYFPEPVPGSKSTFSVHVAIGGEIKLLLSAPSQYTSYSCGYRLQVHIHFSVVNICKYTLSEVTVKSKILILI